MKLIEKLKNALFEEEYVEIEEKPKKQKVQKKEKENNNKKIKKEDKPIAKKIVSTEKKEYVPNTREEEVELKDEDFEIEAISDRDVLTDKNDYKFPVMEESDFNMEDTIIKEEPKVEEKEIKLYQASKKEEETTGPYGLPSSELPKYDYLHQEMEENAKTYFKPSPIISPIYGILDKNYKKDDVISKREVRMSPSFVKGSLDVDEVRKKAFGTLSDDIEINTHEYQEIEEEQKENEDTNDTLLDLSSKEDAPEVKKVTVGDAEEYFEDLGLEYNVDYKDATKEKATGRRMEKNKYDEQQEDTTQEEKPDYVDEIKIKDKADNMDDDDNLFDLIDSMYENE